jgi:hypothetical protein
VFVNKLSFCDRPCRVLAQKFVPTECGIRGTATTRERGEKGQFHGSETKFCPGKRGTALEGPKLPSVAWLLNSQKLIGAAWSDTPFFSKSRKGFPIRSVLPTEETSLEIEKLQVICFWSNLTRISCRWRKIESRTAEYWDIPIHGSYQT